MFLDLRIDGDQLRAVENLLLALRDARPGKRLPRESEAAPTVPQPGLESQPTPDITDPTSESLHSRQAPFGSTDADDTSADPDDRPYKQDRPKALQEPLQWFAPLPNRRVEPLTPGQLNQRRADLKLAAAEQLLDEAVRLMDYRDARIKAAESKGTTLMGTVAIASSLVIAGAGLLLDSTHITGGWRDAVMILIASLLLFLIMCGYIASRGVLEVRRQSRPGTRAALRRAGLDDPREVMLDRAIDLFGRAGENRWVADYKLAQVRVAHGWYRLALVTFLLLGFTLTVYVVTR